MALLPAFDLDLLRTLVLIAEDGSFTRAAVRIGRTQSAVSLQMQRLEAFVGCPLIDRRKGGTIELTADGIRLVAKARHLLAMNDEMLNELRPLPARTEIRLGAWEDYSRLTLQEVFASFSREHPTLAIEVSSGLSCQLLPFLMDDRLDVLLCDRGMEPPGWPCTELWQTRMRWITATEGGAHQRDPLPVALGPRDCPWRPRWLSECLWRRIALDALKAAGRAFEIVQGFTTIASQYEEVLAGRAVTVTTLPVLPPRIRTVRPDEGLPQLPEVSVLLLKAPRARQPATDIFADFLARTFGPVMDMLVAEATRQHG